MIHQGLSKLINLVPKVKSDWFYYFFNHNSHASFCLWKPFSLFFIINFYFAALSSSRTTVVRWSVCLYVRWLSGDVIESWVRYSSFVKIVTSQNKKNIFWSNRKKLCDQPRRKFVFVSGIFCISRENWLLSKKIIQNPDKLKSWNFIKGT